MASGTPDLALREHPAFAEDVLVDTLRGLVQTRSRNPEDGEVAIAERIAGALEGTGAEVELVEFAPGRPSVGAVLGAGDGPRLVLNGHMDTIGVDDPERWTTEPWAGEVRDGYLYGRGAVDMKAGLTTQIAVAHYLAERRDRMTGRLVLQFAAGEELGEPGTLSLLEAGYGGDVGIVTEPTQLRVATAQRGLAVIRIRLTGRSIHASSSEETTNPLWALGGVLDVVREYDEQVRAKPHVVLPGGSCTPTIVQGGIRETAVPDFVELSLDRRLLPGETAAEELAELDARLAAVRAAEPEVEIALAPVWVRDPAEIDVRSDFARRVRDGVAAVTGSAEPLWGTPFGSDVNYLVNEGGIEAVTFGPGNCAEAHAPDERVSVRQLREAAMVIGAVADDLLLDGGAG